MPRIVKKFADRKAEIIQAARHLFLTKNYDQTTMQDVMRVLDIAKGTIYHYFKSKEALLDAVIEDIVDETIKRMKATLEEIQGSALEKIQYLAQTSKKDPANELIDPLHKPGNETLHSRLLGSFLLKQAPIYAELIEEGCREGVFKTKTPRECAEFILSAMQFLTDTGIYPWKQEDIQRRLKAFPALIEQQLQAPSGSFEFLLEQLQ